MLETLAKNARFSLRSMRRTPVMTIAVVATLAIGIGANTAVFSVINGILIKPLPYSDPERLVSVAHLAPASGKRWASDCEAVRREGGMRLWASRETSGTGDRAGR
jgi:hypothetical protein